MDPVGNNAAFPQAPMQVPGNYPAAEIRAASERLGIVITAVDGPGSAGGVDFAASLRMSLRDLLNHHDPDTIGWGGRVSNARGWIYRGQADQVGVAPPPERSCACPGPFGCDHFAPEVMVYDWTALGPRLDELDAMHLAGCEVFFITPNTSNLSGRIFAGHLTYHHHRAGVAYRWERMAST